MCRKGTVKSWLYATHTTKEIIVPSAGYVIFVQMIIGLNGQYRNGQDQRVKITLSQVVNLIHVYEKDWSNTNTCKYLYELQT